MVRMVSKAYSGATSVETRAELKTLPIWKTSLPSPPSSFFFFFFFNDTAPTEIYTLSLTTLFRSLVADPAHRGTGVGRELVRFAERRSREQGLATMQLEVLVPRQWSHPSKEFLKAWYTRIGYRPVRTGQ